jgi:hypothetical protein
MIYLGQIKSNQNCVNKFQTWNPPLDSIGYQNPSQWSRFSPYQNFIIPSFISNMPSVHDTKKSVMIFILFNNKHRNPHVSLSRHRCLVILIWWFKLNIHDLDYTILKQIMWPRIGRVITMSRLHLPCVTRSSP